MGFLKFLKKEKKQDFDDLDLPPAPPPLEGFEENLPEPPEMPDFDEKSSAPEYKDDFKFDMPDKEEPMPELEDMDLDKEIGMDKDLDMGNFEKEMAMPEMEEPEEQQPQMQQANIPAAQTISSPPMDDHDVDEQPAAQNYYPKRGLFAHRAPVRQRPTARTVYVRVEDFKAMLGTINIIRSDLRKSDEALMKLESIKSSKDKSFDRIKLHLDDLQKKLIFVDKTLFEEE